MTFERHGRGAFARRQVSHLVGDGPARGRRLRGPLRRVESAEQSVEDAMFVAQVRED
jgi:hypothetical protein